MANLCKIHSLVRQMMFSCCCVILHCCTAARNRRVSSITIVHNVWKVTAFSTFLPLCDYLFSCSSLTITRWTGVSPWPVRGFWSSPWSSSSVSSTPSRHTGIWANTSTPLLPRRSVFPTIEAKPSWIWSSCCPCWCSSAFTWCTEPSCCTVKCSSVPPTGASARSTTSTSPFASFSRYWWTNTRGARCSSSSSSSGSPRRGCSRCVRGKTVNSSHLI